MVRLKKYMEFDSLGLNILDILHGVNSYWAIPGNIHTIPWTASLFYPPPALRISTMGYLTVPLKFHSH